MITKKQELIIDIFFFIISILIIIEMSITWSRSHLIEMIFWVIICIFTSVRIIIKRISKYN